MCLLRRALLVEEGSIKPCLGVFALGKATCLNAKHRFGTVANAMRCVCVNRITRTQNRIKFELKKKKTLGLTLRVHSLEAPVFWTHIERTLLYSSRIRELLLPCRRLVFAGLLDRYASQKYTASQRGTYSKGKLICVVFKATVTRGLCTKRWRWRRAHFAPEKPHTSLQGNI